jgi:hypothetical protein
MPTSLQRATLLGLIASLTLTTPARAGFPWISVELPANPYSNATRGAYCLVRVYHHGNAAFFPLEGTAEGLVNGERRSVPLELTSTAEPGVYALKYQPESRGTWLLVIQTTDRNLAATVLITIGRDGNIAAVKVPTREGQGYVAPRALDAGEVDALLNAEVASR